MRSRQNQGMTEAGRIKTGTQTARMRSVARRKASGVGKDEESPVIVPSWGERVIVLRWWKIDYRRVCTEKEDEVLRVLGRRDTVLGWNWTQTGRFEEK